MNTLLCTAFKGSGIIPGPDEHTTAGCDACEGRDWNEGPKATIVVNLYGGPGSGKSTMAAMLFASLKGEGHSVELVREYVKNWTWRGHKIDQTWDQPYLFAKQLRAESAVYGKVDTVITDSPLGLCMVYERLYSKMPVRLHVASALYEWSCAQQREAGIKRLNLLVVRHKAYVQSGRYEDEASALKVDEECKASIPNLIPVNNVGDALRALENFGQTCTNPLPT